MSIALTQQISTPGFKDASILSNFFSLNEELRSKIERKHLVIENICFLHFYSPYIFTRHKYLYLLKNIAVPGAER
jgi:hypothetical protein